jgi:ketosteroid isomerase-like protein
MSQENVALVRRVYEALERRDMDAVLSFFADDFEFDISRHPIPDFPNVGRGVEHLKRFFGTYLSGFSDYRVEVINVIEAEDKVVAVLHDTASLGAGFAERDFAQVWTFRDGAPVRLQVFTTTEQALEAVGLSE